jgi:PDDEXK-like uncharacterized protein DUF3799
MAQAFSHLSRSEVSVDQVAGTINGMIAERAAERLRKPPAEPASEAPKAPAPLKLRAPGVYFNLPMGDYHADPSLGSTDLKALLVHPACYWQRSHMNPERSDDSDSPAKKIGRALHAFVLEGGAGFIEEPSPTAYPGALVTLEDLKNKCRELCEAVSGTKAELAKRIRAKTPDVIIFDDILGLFRAMVERDGLEVLKVDAMAEVRAAAANIKLNPHLARAFTGGAAEVCVFWIDEDGLPCKARYDYLKPRTIVNLKKFANQRQRPVDLAIHLAIAEYRYDLQAKHYLDSYPYLYAAAREGRVFGKCPLPAGWERQIADPEAIVYSWVFHQMDGPPVTVGRQIAAQSSALNRATREVAHAKALYRDCIAKYGTNRWVADEPIVELTDTDLPIWMREGTEEYA